MAKTGLLERHNPLMDYAHAKRRFEFLGHAYDGAGQFSPKVAYEFRWEAVKDSEENIIGYAVRKIPKFTGGECALVQYSRESPEKFAGRVAAYEYENHLKEYSSKFASYLMRRRPMRDYGGAELIGQFINDCDGRETTLSFWMASFIKQARARGSMLALLDPPTIEPVSEQEQIVSRAIPRLRVIKPECVKDFKVSDEDGLFEFITLPIHWIVDGKEKECVIRFDRETWIVFADDSLKEQLDGDNHGMGQCPVIAFTEDGEPYPYIGEFAQIADFSKSISQIRSLIREIQTSQTFGIYHIPVKDTSDIARINAMTATIGTNSAIVFDGSGSPGFSSPSADNVTIHQTQIDARMESIRRIALDDASEAAGAESGIARRLRFERLNARLASYATQMQIFENRIFKMLRKYIGSGSVKVSYPTDFNMVDSLVELDILISMKATGFPEAVLSEKRQLIAAAEFDASDEKTKEEIAAAIEEQAIAPPEPPGGQATV